MIKTVLILLLALTTFFLLYKNGYLVYQNKRALSFIGKNRGKEASFDHCSGFIKRYISFKETKTYKFHFNLSLTKGSVKLELMDGSHTILSLDSKNTETQLSLEANKKYLMKVTFEKASGTYQIEYE